MKLAGDSAMTATSALPIKIGTVPAGSGGMTTEDAMDFSLELAAADPLGKPGRRSPSVRGEDAPDAEDVALAAPEATPLLPGEQATAILALLDPGANPAPIADPVESGRPLISSDRALAALADTPLAGLDRGLAGTAVRSLVAADLAATTTADPTAPIVTTPEPPAIDADAQQGMSAASARLFAGLEAKSSAGETQELGKAPTGASAMTMPAAASLAGQAFKGPNTNARAELDPAALAAGRMAIKDEALANTSTGDAGAETGSGGSDTNPLETLRELAGNGAPRLGAPAFGPALGLVQASESAGVATPVAGRIAFDAGFAERLGAHIAEASGIGGPIRLQVTPEHLGRIDIEWLSGPEGDRVRLVTENDAVRQTLINAQPRLENELRQQGQRAEVSIDLRQQGAQADARGQQGQGPQQGPRGEALGRSLERPASQTANSEPAPRTVRRPDGEQGHVRYA